MTVETHFFPTAEDIPNSNLPLIVITGEIEADQLTANDVQQRFRRHGWQGTWVYTVFDYWHFHLDGHEVLTCVSGEAVVGFGGEEANGGITLPMLPGDTVIVPAGVGHKRLSGSSEFKVVGGYPPGQSGTITRAGTVDVEASKREIAKLALPERDPISGAAPGALNAWH
ncbi:hypothetical protein FP2506_09716 [Fulvimarina pelagi HTCC2506]|uniref:Cupin type-1 domain-containing protein n=1 Tax=Fulvimarina pelagi HTCC2506 TaxID=314231 RepID=Q0G5F3_9HYPH|nr:hypothetical protein [Fulvimarina pelagi]EAU43111.1 hypothetical protein FP2506_09716 [Fulvimarina pelagi HTCC2506]